MDPACEIIEISSDEDEIDEYTIVGVKRKWNGKPDDDDDCVILDGEPENVAASAEYADIGVDVSDEMLIVGEKGQFACRDYPHPRYLCATFLFSMTPHEKYCDMCHCYVCDCRAPCIYWLNHCSSTHKDLRWRAERQLFKRKKRELQQPRQRFDVKPSGSASKKQVHGKETSLLLSDVEAKPIIQNARKRIPRKTLVPHAEPVVSRPKDVLCEIYKISPVISCRRRIPRSHLLDDISDIEEGD